MELSKWQIPSLHQLRDYLHYQLIFISGNKILINQEFLSVTKCVCSTWQQSNDCNRLSISAGVHLNYFNNQTTAGIKHQSQKHIHSTSPSIQNTFSNTYRA